MKKEYHYNEKIKYIKGKISTTQIDKVFWPLLIEIILRRNVQFNLSDAFFKRDVNTFVNNVKKIEIKDLRDNHLGVFDHVLNKIVLNKKMFNENTNLCTIFEVLAHECNHAMNFKKVKIIKRDRAFDKRILNTIEPTAIMEAFTQSETQETIQNIESSGYSTIIPFVDVIAVSFGIKRNDLLSAAVRERSALNRILNKSISKGFANSSILDNQYFERFGLNIGLFHAARYKPKKIISKKRANKNIEKSKINRQNAAKEIFKTAENVIIQRLNNIQANSINEFREQFENIVIDEENVETLMTNATLELFSNREDELKNSIINTYNLAHLKMVCMDTILKDFSIINRMQLLSILQNENDINRIYDFMQDNGILINFSKEIFVFHWKKEQRYDEIFAAQNEWNNANVEQYIYDHFYEMIKPKLSIIDRVKIWASNKTKALNEHYMETLPEGNSRRTELNSSIESNNPWDISNYTGYDMDIGLSKKHDDKGNTHKENPKDYR